MPWLNQWIQEDLATHASVWKTNSAIPQKMFTLIFEYSDEVDKEKRGSKSMTILHYVSKVSFSLSFAFSHLTIRNL